MNKHSNKALISSIIALVLCCAMLVGTTFAWFTDEAKTGINKIQTGTLDVVLEYWNGTEYVEVTSETLLFDNAAKWEPGHAEVAYLKVSNAGDLALKYQLNVNVFGEVIGKTKDGQDLKLSEHLVFGVVEKQITSSEDLYTRQSAMAAAGTVQGLNTYNGATKALTQNGDADYLALIIYMPTSVGNEANHDGVHVPSIQLGVELFATQFTYENDQYGPDYDADAWQGGMQVYNEQDLQAALNAGESPVLMQDILVEEPVVVPAPQASGYSLRAAAPAQVLDLNGHTLSVVEDKRADQYALTNLGNLVLVDSVGGGSINARGIYNGSSTNNAAKLTVLGVTINALGASGGAAIYNYGEVAILSGTFTSVGSYSLNNNGGVMVIDDATVTGGIYNVGELVINDGHISTNRGGYTHAIYSSGGSLEINGGVFTGNGNEVVNANSDVAIINGGSFQKLERGTYLMAGSNMIINNGEFYAYAENPAAHPVRPDVTINGGTYNYKPTNVADGNCVVEDTDGSWIILPGEGAVLVSEGLYYNEVDTYFVTNAAGLKAVAHEVNKVAQYTANIFDGKTVLLMTDIDLGGEEWTPIGNFGLSSNQFTGIFDGQGHTVSNFKVTQKSTDSKNRSSYGFFGNISNATIKNLTITEASVDVVGGKFAGVLVGRANNSCVIENCHVADSSVTVNNWQVGGLVGQLNEGNTRISDCTIENTVISGYSAAAILVGYQMGTKTNTNIIENCVAKNCHVVQNGTFGEAYDEGFGLAVGDHGSATTQIQINNCTFEGCTVKGEETDVLCNSFEGSLVVDGAQYVSTEAEMLEALNAGYSVILNADIEMTQVLAIQGANIHVDGNGHTITQSADCTNLYALFDLAGGKASFTNVTFDGIQGGAVIRTVDVELVVDNITVKNCVVTQIQGLLRLLGKSTLLNSTFLNNTCNMVVTMNYDGANSDPQVVRNCVFQGNICNDLAVLYYVKGAGATLDGNSFLNNQVINTSESGNCATVYMGFTEHNVITNNIFMGNSLTTTSTSKRVAGALMIGYDTVITGNAFVDNTAVAADGHIVANDICASVYYTDIDLSGNYWGGGAPVENDDYFVEYPTRHQVIVNDYLTEMPG